ncbi:MAG: SulP family inorganic anion transporter [Planctomycetota bacterium]|nr:SulP family inorganic anion transporter [Planctomycetota bacterium]
MQTKSSSSTSFKASELIQNLTAGLTVSFVAISLGAAFGILSGRGAFAGILSAGVIAFITSLFGGTRIQCSGPTGPMTAVTVLLVGYAFEVLPELDAQADPDRFINMVLVLTGVVMGLAALFRMGRFIMLVPRTVISGFMNGIAVLIWWDQVKQLFGLGGKVAIGGELAINLAVAFCTLVLVFLVPKLVKSYLPKARLFLPGTIVAIVLMTAAVHVLGWAATPSKAAPQDSAARAETTAAEQESDRPGNGGIELTTLKKLESFADLDVMLRDNIPNQWSWSLVLLGLPWAAQLAMLAYLDSLLTALVVDKKLSERTGVTERSSQNRELAAQGAANAFVSLFGGIPGAQATIRSVLILNENATLRLAGVSVGVFVAVEMLLLQDYLSLIPKAVFTGVLFKVGYDVFDWPPVTTWLANLRGRDVQRNEAETPAVDSWDMVFIGGTTIVTAVVNLNLAVITFTILFYVVRVWRPLSDLGAREAAAAEAAAAQAGEQTP